MVEITSEKQNKVKRMKRAEDSLRDLWDDIKWTNIGIIGVPEEEEKKKGYEKIFEEIIVENFPNREKEIVNQVQEAQRCPYRINPRRNMPRHILIKLTKTKHKERTLKAAREKQQVTYKGNPIHLTADLPAETLQARYSNLGCRFFPFSTLNISCHSLLAFRVSAERSAIKYMGFPLLLLRCCF